MHKMPEIKTSNWKCEWWMIRSKSRNIMPFWMYQYVFCAGMVVDFDETSIHGATIERQKIHKIVYMFACVCITIFSVNNGNDLVPFHSVFEICRQLHNFATFYEFGFCVLFTACSVFFSCSVHSFATLLFLSLFFLLLFTSVFIIAFACYAVVSSSFSVSLGNDAKQNKEK